MTVGRQSATNDSNITFRIDSVTLRWGLVRPGPPGPNVPPPSHPVRTRRATDYVVLGSSDGSHWHRLAKVSGHATGTNDTLHIRPTKVRYLRLKITAATKGLEGKEEPPLLEELRAFGR